MRYITKNNENTVVCECEFNIQHGRAGACSCRTNQQIYYCFRLLSNLKNTLNRRDRACPCPQQTSYKIKFTDNRKGCPYGCANILISYQPKIVINQRQSNGGSKPPPYHVVVCTVSFATAFGCLSLAMQLLLFRKNHARLACSVVNALTTAHCRYQLLRFADRGALWSPANS